METFRYHFDSSITDNQRALIEAAMAAMTFEVGRIWADVTFVAATETELLDADIKHADLTTVFADTIVVSALNGLPGDGVDTGGWVGISNPLSNTSTIFDLNGYSDVQSYPGFNNSSPGGAFAPSFPSDVGGGVQAFEGLARPSYQIRIWENLDNEAVMTSRGLSGFYGENFYYETVTHELGHVFNGATITYYRFVEIVVGLTGQAIDDELAALGWPSDLLPLGMFFDSDGAIPDHYSITSAWADLGQESFAETFKDMFQPLRKFNNRTNYQLPMDRFDNWKEAIGTACCPFQTTAEAVNPVCVALSSNGTDGTGPVSSKEIFLQGVLLLDQTLPPGGVIGMSSTWQSGDLIEAFITAISSDVATLTAEASGLPDCIEILPDFGGIVGGIGEDTLYNVIGPQGLGPAFREEFPIDTDTDTNSPPFFGESDIYTEDMMVVIPQRVMAFIATEGIAGISIIVGNSVEGSIDPTQPYFGDFYTGGFPEDQPDANFPSMSIGDTQTVQLASQKDPRTIFTGLDPSVTGLEGENAFQALYDTWTHTAEDYDMSYLFEWLYSPPVDPTWPYGTVVIPIVVTKQTALTGLTGGPVGPGRSPLSKRPLPNNGFFGRRIVGIFAFVSVRAMLYRARKIFDPRRKEYTWQTKLLRSALDERALGGSTSDRRQKSSGNGSLRASRLIRRSSTRTMSAASS